MKLFLQNAVLRIARSINAPVPGYGQIGDSWDLPVNGRAFAKCSAR